LAPGSRADSKVRRWSIRAISAVAEAASLEFAVEYLSGLSKRNPLNRELKLIARLNVEAVTSPALITDRETIIAFDDVSGALRWGILFQGRQYAALFARWFDEFWSRVPDSHLAQRAQSEGARLVVRKELEAGEAASDRRTA
jgi:hypothetical protein